MFHNNDVSWLIFASQLSNMHTFISPFANLVWIFLPPTNYYPFHLHLPGNSRLQLVEVNAILMASNDIDFVLK